MIYGDYIICFPKNENEQNKGISDDFFLNKKRKGQKVSDIKYVELKKRASKFIVQATYGIDSVYITPILFDIEESKGTKDDYSSAIRSMGEANTGGFPFSYNNRDYYYEFNRVDSFLYVNLRAR